MIEVVGILVAAGDGEHAGAQDVGDAVRHQQRIARIGDHRRQPVGDPETPLGRGQQHHAAVGGDAPAIEGGGDFLAVDGWKLNGSRLSSVMAGVASVRFGGRIGFDTQSLSADQTLTRHPPANPCHAVNKMG